MGGQIMRAAYLDRNDCLFFRVAIWGMILYSYCGSIWKTSRSYGFMIQTANRDIKISTNIFLPIWLMI